MLNYADLLSSKGILPCENFAYLPVWNIRENDISEPFLLASRLHDFSKCRMCEGLSDKSRFSMELNISITRNRTYCRVKT